ncbi:MAG: serine protease [Pseudonocardia sp.]
MITPGALMITSVSPEATSACTAAFVFRNERATFLAYAAHCAIPVQDKKRSGCEYDTLPLGTRVEIQGTAGARAYGSLAYSSWRTMREIGESDDDRCRFNDLALVEIDTVDAGSVDPTVPVVGGPSGIDRTPPERFERVVSYQPYVTEPAMKQGVMLGTRGGGWLHRVDVAPAANLGDSGSGLLGPDGTAFGILATRYLDRLATSGVTDLRLALAYAQRYGQVGELELVPGRTPFRAPTDRIVQAATAGSESG